LNSILFHCSRNLIVFRSQLGLREVELSDSWMVAIILSPFVLAIMTLYGHFHLVPAVLVYVYLIAQSLFERETEYLRSSMDLKGYLLVACGRPLWSLAGIGLIWLFRGESWLSLVAFLAVSVSPMLACLPKWRDVIGRLSWQGLSSFRNAAKVIPLGMVVTVSISYIFVSDALIKLTLHRLIEKPVFGLYASCADLIMPACWILMGAFTWDFVPRVLRADRGGQLKVIIDMCKPVAGVLALMLFFMIVVPDMRLFGFQLHVRTYSGLAMANLSAAALSCLLFPALIAIGYKYAALVGSICGIVLNLVLLGWFGSAAHGAPTDVLMISRLIVAAHAMALMLASGLLYAACMRVRSRCYLGS
jgi:hypothetical protein